MSRLIPRRRRWSGIVNSEDKDGSRTPGDTQRHASRSMSPTILREKGYRFFFFSREESRMHVHVTTSDGEVKYWLEPDIELARNHKLSRAQLKEIEHIIEVHYDEFRSGWKDHFRG